MNDRSLAQPEMNATPLIDVLLVLLVMLIFTLPVATHAVKLNLPQLPDGVPSPIVMIHVDFDGQLQWNGVPVSDLDALAYKFLGLATGSGDTRVKIIPDDRVRYEHVARVLAAAQRSGVTRLEVQGVG
jgi:biopolymer transport protein ExbD